MKAGRLVAVLVFVFICLATTCGPATAAPGDLDRFFGREGIVSLGGAQGTDQAAPKDMVVGPDNEIYVLRRQVRCISYAGCADDLIVTRHDPHGSLDPSFASDGLSGAFGSPGYGGFALQGSLAMDRDRKVIVAAADRGALVLARLNSDGSLDGSFGAHGLTRATLGVPISRVQVAVQSDGKIVVGTDSEPGYGEASVIVARYTNQGLPDPAFHSGTPIVTSLGSGLGGLALTNDGGIAIAGPRCCSVAGRAVHIGLLEASGVFDRRFGNRGHRFVDDVARVPRVGAVMALANGRIVVVGNDQHDGDAFALRLLPDGRLDHAFGDDGVAIMQHSDLSVAGALVDEGGRLVVVGQTSRASGRPGSTLFTLLRRRPNGRPDRTFAGGSPVRLGLNGEARVSAIGLQAGGRILALVETGQCERYCSPPKSILARYLGGSSGARCIGKKATIVGTRVGETLTGTPHRDVIAALSGEDVVRGRGGNDLVCGGRGNDRLIGGQGKDRLVGGAGHDHIRR